MLTLAHSNFFIKHLQLSKRHKGFPGNVSGKEPPANTVDARDTGLIPGFK